MTDKEHIAKWLKGKLAELCNEIQCEVSELPKDVIEGKILAFKEILSYMKSLQEEPASEELEKEIDRYWKNAPTGTLYFPMWKYFQIIAHHFAEWGKKQAEIEIQAQSMALTHGCPKEGEE